MIYMDCFAKSVAMQLKCKRSRSGVGDNAHITDILLGCACVLDVSKMRIIVTDQMMLESAKNVRSTVAARLARRIHKIQQLPFIVGINPHINMLHDLYFDVFSQLIASPEPKTNLDERTMTHDLFPLLLRSTVSVMPMLGRYVFARNALRGQKTPLHLCVFILSRLLFWPVHLPPRTLEGCDFRVCRASLELRKVMPLAQLTELFNSLLTGRILRRTLMQHHMSLDLLYRQVSALGVARLLKENLGMFLIGFKFSCV